MRVFRQSTYTVLGICFWMTLVSQLFASEPDEAWRYTTSSDIRPAARSMDLEPQVPPEFEIEAKFSGDTQWYAQLRYGSENSRRIVVVLDQIAADPVQFDFYADMDRDRVLRQDEKLDGMGRSRRTRMAAELIREDQVQQEDRIVELKLGLSGSRLSVATVGCIEGSVPNFRGDGRLAVRRIDGDANGLFGDALDRAQIDWDQNGDWDLVTEQFLQLPILKIAGRRFGLKADRLGKRFSLAEISGTGLLDVSVSGLATGAKLQTLEAFILANDGSAYAVRSAHTAIEVPVGKYVLGGMTLTVDVGERDLWHYVFSRAENPTDEDWQTVSANVQTTLEAVGKLRFELGQRQQVIQPDDSIDFDPALFTESGLLINLCSKGRQIGSFDQYRSHQKCKIELMDAGQTIGSTQTGFS
ncbi:MAG: hypothetical protein KDA87_17625 [Planctomycetales bacterium]|nr:hypothetical protein [Planctomycetales bacterium]